MKGKINVSFYSNSRMMKCIGSTMKDNVLDYRVWLKHVRSVWYRGSAWILGPLFIGLVAVFLAVASVKVGKWGEYLFERFRFVPLLVLPVGFSGLVWLGNRFFMGTQGSGIPQAIAAIDQQDDRAVRHLLSFRIFIGKIVLTLSGLFIGASIGREGPTVQIGASIMHMFYGRGPFQGAEQRRMLLMVGGAAGIAAAFNTPLAGIMFAIEELSRKHVFNANNSALLAVIVTGLISMALLGNYTYFGVSSASLDWNGGLATIAICGAVGGICGGMFSRLLIALTGDGWKHTHRLRADHPFLFAGSCGFGVAVLGVLTHGHVLGTGYAPTLAMLQNGMSFSWYFGLAKFLATLLSSVSGIAGGLFAPSLAVGAGVGANLAALLPFGYAPHAAIILLSMTAYLSGVTQAPATSFIITMEMTDDHHMLLPLMAASLLASAVAKRMISAPLYHVLADRWIERA